MTHKQIMLNEQLKACSALIRAYREYIQRNPVAYQPNNPYYRALLTEHKRIQEQIIDEQIREFVYGNN